jgi:hypothetical protein
MCYSSYNVSHPCEIYQRVCEVTVKIDRFRKVQKQPPKGNGVRETRTLCQEEKLVKEKKAKISQGNRNKHDADSLLM